MLDFMRRNANSWVMVLLFGIIIFVFAINFGPWAGSNLSSVPYAAIVNNETISLAEFRAAYSAQITRMKQFRPDYDEAQAEREGLKRMVIDQLVTKELLNQLGKKKDFFIGAKPLAEEIKERVFGKDGQFDKDEYVRRINAYFQASVSQFEEQVEKEMVAQQMVDVLATGAFVSKQETISAFKDRNTKLVIEYIKVDPKYFAKDNPIPNDKIEEFKQSHGKEINDYYNEHLGEYVKQEQIRASHILKKFSPNASAKEKEQLRKKAQDIKERLNHGEDFAKLAKEESEDPGSKNKGGDLGLFSRGMMVESFSNAAFALKLNQVSDVVESPFGFHIIKKLEEKPKEEKKLDEVSGEIAQILMHDEAQKSKAKELATAALKQLRSGVALKNVRIEGLAHNKPASLNAPVAAETEPFTINSSFIDKIGRAEKIANRAFVLTVDDRTPKDVILENDSFYAIRLKSRQDADMAKLKDQEESIRSSLLYPRRRSLLQQYIDYLKDNAKISYNQDLVAEI